MVTATLTRAAPAAMGKKFSDTLFVEARHKALYGGRGSGKSWAVATYLVTSAASPKSASSAPGSFRTRSAILRRS